MKKTSRLIIWAAAGIMALCAAACQKDDTLRYNNATMGNIVNGTFVSDQGNTLNVVDQTCAGKLDTLKRAFIVCDVLNTTEGVSNGYDVRLNYISHVLTKEVLPSSELKDSLANDPIIISDLWISGGYINMYLIIPVNKDSHVKHMINLVHDQEGGKSGEYSFLLRHDASGEILKEDNISNGMVLAGAYVSFPVSSLIKENTVTINVKWNSYIVYPETANVVSHKTEEYSVSRSYQKGGFEHAPLNAPKGKTQLAIR